MLVDRLDSSVVAYSNLAVAASKAVVAQQVNFNDEIERRAESTQKEPVDKVDVNVKGSDSGKTDSGNTQNKSTGSNPADNNSAPAVPVRGKSVDLKV